MRLVRRPYHPRWTVSAQILLAVNKRFKEWEPFLKAS